MNFIQTVIMGIVEGITEFLPISSTGHLIITANLLKIPQTDFVKSFEIAIQLGAILAVVVLYWKYLFEKKIVLKILAAFLPTGAIGFLLYKLIKQFLIGNEHIVVYSLLIGGIALIGFELFFNKKIKTEQIEKISYRDCILIGVFQAIAVIPGVSRSAATIVGGLALGVSRRAIVEFSFLLAVPTMLAATGLDIVQNASSWSANQISTMALGFAISFIFAIISIKFLLKFIKNNNFIPFGIYRIIIAIFLLIFILK